MKRPPERRIPVTRFEAECLALLDEVARTGRALVVTKHGRPIARLVPLDGVAPDLRGSVVEHGDIVSPLEERWNAQG